MRGSIDSQLVNRPDICLAVADLAKYRFPGVEIHERKTNRRRDASGLNDGTNDLLSFNSSD